MIKDSITGERYEEIKEVVADMYEDLGYTEFPVNVYELCHRLGIRLIKYSALKPDCTEYSMHCSDDGFLLFNIDRGCYQVYYNDRMPPERIRFTIMHEIAHIMLEHTKHTAKNEQEANFFAKTALVPLGMIYKLRLSNSFEIADTFGISIEFARNIVAQYNKSMIYPSICEREANNRLVALFYQEKMEVG
ncbi:MAG: ImmA/IrrE family metallo-endopeptidase [Treponema sp.]|nr:ImmA/IrrE family metallo-endopeptidase [Treponema sp.]